MTQQERAKEKQLLLEAGFFAAYGKAITAGNIAISDHDPNDWFPCGNAHVMIKPRNSKFSKWLVREKFGRDADYMKCILISNTLSTQSMNCNVQFASAVARVLREEFSIDATIWSYID